MATATEMGKLVGRRGSIHLGSTALRFDVEIHDVKVAWGKTRVLVGAVAGMGFTWVELSTVKLDVPAGLDHVGA